MSRVQLALRVSDLEGRQLLPQAFGVSPRSAAPATPTSPSPSPRSSSSCSKATARAHPSNHLGVEVEDAAQVTERARLANEGLATDVEENTTCCYARQDKVWVRGPGRERWEVYTVLADSQTFWGQDGSQSWDLATAALDEAPGASAREQGTQCCGGPRLTSETDAAVNITTEAAPGPRS